MPKLFSRQALFLVASLMDASLFLLDAQEPAAAKGKSKSGPPGANHPERTQVLIITGQNPHDWRGTTASLRKTLEETEKFEVREIDEFRGGTAEMRAPYQLVILNYYDGRRPVNRFGEKGDQALVDFVKGGKGLVIYHLSLGAFEGWADYEKMAVGNWRPNQGEWGGDRQGDDTSARRAAK